MDAAGKEATLGMSRVGAAYACANFSSRLKNEMPAKAGRLRKRKRVRMGRLAWLTLVTDL
jgi:predicted metalloendopeptidase